MRTALILDAERLAEEQPMFNRLCVGLLADGIYPVRVVPSDFDQTFENPEERRVALLSRVGYPPKVLPWQRRARAARLADELDRLGVQLVHAAGASIWPLATAVARTLERPLVLGVWSLWEADRVRGHATDVAAWLAPSERIAARIRRHVDPSLVHLVPAGVPVSALPPEPPAADPHRSRFIVGLGDGVDVRAWDSFLPAIRRIIEQPTFEDLQVVLEVRGPRGHDIWRKVRDLDLLDRVCSLGDAAEHRNLLLRGQGLCLPEPMLMLRTIVLEAMARGIPVAAVAAAALDDSAADSLAGGGTGIIGVVGESDRRRPGADIWVAALQRMLGDEETVRRQTRLAWQRIHAEHRSSGQAAGVAALYRAIVHGDALPFGETRT